jgi:hypothetical protein
LPEKKESGDPAAECSVSHQVVYLAGANSFRDAVSYERLITPTRHAPERLCFRFIPRLRALTLRILEARRVSERNTGFRRSLAYASGYHFSADLNNAQLRNLRVGFGVISAPTSRENPMPLLAPQLRTERLLLRGVILADAPRIQELAGDRDIASTTLRIPHPYEDGMAEAWIASHPQLLEAGTSLPLAVVLAQTQQFIGAVGLEINAEYERAGILIMASLARRRLS